MLFGRIPTGVDELGTVGEARERIVRHFVFHGVAFSQILGIGQTF